jgi:hypothetical protein
MAKRKYSQEPKLINRKELPALLVAERIDALDDLLGITFGNIIEGLGVSAEVKQALLRKRGCIPNSVASTLLRRLPEPVNGFVEGERAENDRKLHHIVSSLGPKTPLVPAGRIVELVQRVADIRHIDSSLLYKEMSNFFHLQNVWPQNFSELVNGEKQQRPCPYFPLGCGVYLYLLGDPNRQVLRSDQGRPKCTPGDIYLHRELADIGIVESSAQYGPESRSQILFMQQAAGVLFATA